MEEAAVDTWLKNLKIGHPTPRLNSSTRKGKFRLNTLTLIKGPRLMEGELVLSIGSGSLLTPFTMAL